MATQGLTVQVKDCSLRTLAYGDFVSCSCHLALQGVKITLFLFLRNSQRTTKPGVRPRLFCARSANEYTSKSPNNSERQIYGSPVIRSKGSSPALGPLGWRHCKNVIPNLFIQEIKQELSDLMTNLGSPYRFTLFTNIDQQAKAFINKTPSLQISLQKPT